MKLKYLFAAIILFGLLHLWGHLTKPREQESIMELGDPLEPIVQIGISKAAPEIIWRNEQTMQETPGICIQIAVPGQYCCRMESQ